MKENNLEKRKQLALKLLNELKTACLQMKELGNELTGSCDIFLNSVVTESNREIMELVDEYNGNIRKAEEISTKITGCINTWYEFVKDDKNRLSILFPFKCLAEKKRIMKFVKQSREQISEAMIQNRFIKGKLDAMEEKLRCKAVLKIEQEEKYKTYRDLLETKKELIEELAYLLPTIPGICPIDYSDDNIDELAAKLS